MYRLIFGLWLIAAPLAPSVFAQQNGAMFHLSDLLREARKRNPEIRAAQKKWQAMQARIKPAGTLEDPQIGFQVMYSPKYLNSKKYAVQYSTTLRRIFYKPLLPAQAGEVLHPGNLLRIMA